MFFTFAELSSCSSVPPPFPPLPCGQMGVTPQCTFQMGALRLWEVQAWPEGHSCFGGNKKVGETGEGASALAGTKVIRGFPGGAHGKEPAANAGDVRDVGLIPGSGRAPGGGHGSPLQYSCLENPLDREAWRATVHRVTKSQK